VILASGNEAGHYDASPRGGEPGFVKGAGQRYAADPGCTRKQSPGHAAEHPSTPAGSDCFSDPGVDETLRVNGKARLLDEAGVLLDFRNEKRTPEARHRGQGRARVPSIARRR
jgi:hypothetical protein